MERYILWSLLVSPDNSSTISLTPCSSHRGLLSHRHITTLFHLQAFTPALPFAWSTILLHLLLNIIYSFFKSLLKFPSYE